MYASLNTCINFFSPMYRMKRKDLSVLLISISSKKMATDSRYVSEIHIIASWLKENRTHQHSSASGEQTFELLAVFLGKNTLT